MSNRFPPLTQPFQVVPSGDEGEFPPTTILLDRTQELEQLRSALLRARLIVITGPESALVLDLGSRLHPSTPDIGGLIRAIGARQVTVVIDNLDATDTPTKTANQLATLLRGCPNLRVVAASISRPQIHGLVEISLPLLPVPHTGQETLSELRQLTAVQLWLQLRGDGDSAQMVRRAARRVRLVDGLPLGIVSDATAPDTTRRILNSCAKRAFDRMPYTDRLLVSMYSLFHGTWSMELAVRVLSPWMSERQVERSLDRYVDGSIVQRVRTDSNRVEFRMMNHLRTYGKALLKKEGVLTEAELAHTRAMQSLSRDAATDAHTPSHQRWLGVLESVQDDLDAAWNRLTRDEEHDDALELVTNLWPYWRISGALDRYSEGLEYSLEHSTRQDALMANALMASGIVHHLQGHWEQSAARHLRAIELTEALEDQVLLCTAWIGYGDYGVLMGDYDLAERAYLQAEVIATESDWTVGLAQVQLSLASLYRHQRRTEHAAQVSESALQWLSTVEDMRGVAHAHAIIGRLRAELNDDIRASYHLYRALDVAERFQDQTVLAETLEGLAQLAGVHGHHSTATQLLGAASRLRTDTNNPGWATPAESLKLTIRAANAALGAQFDREFAQGRRLSWPAVQSLVVSVPLPVSADQPSVSLAAATPEADRIGLTSREREVLVLLAKGSQDREIAEILAIGVRTVHTHVHRVLTKLGASSRAGAVATAWRIGLLE